MTLGHTNVAYKLCEHDWRALRFGFKIVTDKIASKMPDTIHLCQAFFSQINSNLRVVHKSPNFCTTPVLNGMKMNNFSGV
jgi:hypothetical protein